MVFRSDVTISDHFDKQFNLHLFWQTAIVTGRNKSHDLFFPITFAVDQKSISHRYFDMFYNNIGGVSDRQ